MQLTTKKWIVLFAAAIASLALICAPAGCRKNPPRHALEHVLRSGTLTMITQNNANSYYIYRGRKMGFEYDLAKAFAQRLGVELEVITPGWSDMFEALESGRGDFIAAGLTVTPVREELADFSSPYMNVQQQVVVNKFNRSIRSQEDLEGKTIHVRIGTSYQERIMELQREGWDIKLALHHNVPTEELIRKVAAEKIAITVADSNIAMLNRRYYPDVKIAFPISESQELGWAVRKGADRMLKEIDRFFAAVRQSGTFGKIYERYYANLEIFDYVDVKTFHRRIETRLPSYESIIKKEAERFDFDWRLIAAVVYQESHYNPRARSYTGVKGLMQVTLRTAREMGIENRLDPAQSIHAGVKYLRKIYERFDSIDRKWDRMLITLASYNVGYGHVRDAQEIARRKGLDPKKWESIRQTLPLLRYKKYYKTVRYGYTRGTEPVRYVDRILTYYDILRKKEIT
jgi:membrane-bound lytic murein transglycosylase F